MPTLLAALTLAGLLKISHLGFPAWHLAFWYAALVMMGLLSALPLGAALLNTLGNFLLAWVYFGLLDFTDSVTNRVPHYAVLIVGMLILLGSRFWIDIRVYGVSL
jgi:hypothetical protein